MSSKSLSINDYLENPEEAGPGIADLRAYLQGSWALIREVEDRQTGDYGRFAGEAVFTPAGPELVSREEGVFRFRLYDNVVTRAYRYRFPVPSAAEVSFDHGGLFHRLDLSAGRWVAQHLCGADLYRGAFRVDGADLWHVIWDVTGPGKDHRIATRFTRGLTPLGR